MLYRLVSKLNEHEQLAAALDMVVAQYSDEMCAKYYDEVLESPIQPMKNLIKLGCVDLDSPASVNLYASSFENKDVL